MKQDVRKSSKSQIILAIAIGIIIALGLFAKNWSDTLQGIHVLALLVVMVIFGYTNWKNSYS